MNQGTIATIKGTIERDWMGRIGIAIIKSKSGFLGTTNFFNIHFNNQKV